MMHIDFWPWGLMLSGVGWALVALLICIFVHNGTSGGKEFE